MVALFWICFSDVTQWKIDGIITTPYPAKASGKVELALTQADSFFYTLKDLMSFQYKLKRN